MDIDIDEETGLIRLPEGYRWKVSFSTAPYSHWPSLTVSLQQKAKVFWYKVEDKSWGLGGYSGDKKSDYVKKLSTSDFTSGGGTKYYLINSEEYPELILLLCEYIYAAHLSAVKRDEWSRNFNRVKADLSGHYPPKSL